jgi:pSer/pThr/pTyr-binding forkhead associated (FHA) protein
MIFPPENHFIGFDEGLSNSNPSSRRRLMKSSSHKERYSPANDVQDVPTNHENSQWKRIILLIVAITVHNIPGKFSDDQLGECLTCLGSESQCFCVCQQKNS